MQELVKLKEKAIDSFKNYECEATQFEEDINEHKNAIQKLEREISVLEEGLDTALTESAENEAKVQTASKIASDKQLEVSALERKLQLVIEENTRVNERLAETLVKCSEQESRHENEERQRKTIDAKCLSSEEKFELQQVQLEEAQIIATEAEHKEEEVTRKLKMVQHGLEIMTDRADEFESKIVEYENQIKVTNEKLRDMEILAGNNAEKEDNYESKIKDLTKKLDDMEQKAEFGERSVEKLETTIDGLEASLYSEKMEYQSISKQLDKTLGDMMQLVECGEFNAGRC